MRGFFIIVLCMAVGLLGSWFITYLAGPESWEELVFFGGGGLSACLAANVGKRFGIRW
ncbi:hypothetical protein LCGC14_3041760 [marine sediment metagenome]|uniref:Uncharacterized protein n=1 Tax=marine sediment metagenome TaxID=412755 RepID=A0A0F8WPW8_9ZZZZ